MQGDVADKGALAEKVKRMVERFQVDPAIERHLVECKLVTPEDFAMAFDSFEDVSRWVASIPAVSGNKMLQTARCKNMWCFFNIALAARDSRREIEVAEKIEARSGTGRRLVHGGAVGGAQAMKSRESQRRQEPQGGQLRGEFDTDSSEEHRSKRRRIGCRPVGQERAPFGAGPAGEVTPCRVLVTDAESRETSASVSAGSEDRDASQSSSEASEGTGAARSKNARRRGSSRTSSEADQVSNAEAGRAD